MVKLAAGLLVDDACDWEGTNCVLLRFATIGCSAEFAKWEVFEEGSGMRVGVEDKETGVVRPWSGACPGPPFAMLWLWEPVPLLDLLSPIGLIEEEGL